MAGILLTKVLDILEEYFVQRDEVQVESKVKWTGETKCEDVHVFTEFCGSLCYWQEDGLGKFREDAGFPWISEEEILEKIKEHLEIHPELKKQRQRRKRNLVPGFHLESVLLSSLLPLILEDLCLEEGEVDVSYAYFPGDRPDLTDLDENATWVTLHLKGTKESFCRWCEEQNEEETKFLEEEELSPWKNSEDAIASLRRDVMEKSVLLIPTVKKLREAKQQIEELKRENERLRQKKREIKYAPGRIGALKAQEHFESFTSA
ncbi:hypothetical protein PMV_018 [Port-miou virus]|nr:hypothetical protein PMV_018 [Port-miou virus]